MTIRIQDKIPFSKPYGFGHISSRTQTIERVSYKEESTLGFSQVRYDDNKSNLLDLSDKLTIASFQYSGYSVTMIPQTQTAPLPFAFGGPASASLTLHAGPSYTQSLLGKIVFYVDLPINHPLNSGKLKNAASDMMKQKMDKNYYGNTLAISFTKKEVKKVKTGEVLSAKEFIRLYNKHYKILKKEGREDVGGSYWSYDGSDATKVNEHEKYLGMFVPSMTAQSKELRQAMYFYRNIEALERKYIKDATTFSKDNSEKFKNGVQFDALPVGLIKLLSTTFLPEYMDAIHNTTATETL